MATPEPDEDSRLSLFADSTPAHFDDRASAIGRDAGGRFGDTTQHPLDADAGGVAPPPSRPPRR